MDRLIEWGRYANDGGGDASLPPPPKKKTEKGNERKNNTNKDHSFPHKTGESAQHMDQFLCYSFMGMRFPFLLLLSLLGLISAVASPSFLISFYVAAIFVSRENRVLRNGNIRLFSIKMFVFFVNLDTLYFWRGEARVCGEERRCQKIWRTKRKKEKARCVSLLLSFLPHFSGSDVAIFPNNISGHAPQ